MDCGKKPEKTHTRTESPHKGHSVRFQARFEPHWCEEGMLTNASLGTNYIDLEVRCLDRICGYRPIHINLQCASEPSVNQAFVLIYHHLFKNCEMGFLLIFRLQTILISLVSPRLHTNSTILNNQMSPSWHRSPFLSSLKTLVLLSVWVSSATFSSVTPKRMSGLENGWELSCDYSSYWLVLRMNHSL